jgi:hypothetical protein
MDKEEAEKMRLLENEVAQCHMLLGAIEIATEGTAPNDFELSFPIVRNIWDMRCIIDCSKVHN